MEPVHYFSEGGKSCMVSGCFSRASSRQAYSSSTNLRELCQELSSEVEILALWVLPGPLLVFAWWLFACTWVAGSFGAGLRKLQLLEESML